MDYNKRIAALVSKINSLIIRFSLLKKPVETCIMDNLLKEIQETQDQIAKIKIKREFGA